MNAVQKAVWNDPIDELGYDKVEVRFVTPNDTGCIGEHGPSHSFFAYKPDGAIAEGVVCEDAKEEWYVTGLQLIKEGDEIKRPDGSVS